MKSTKHAHLLGPICFGLLFGSCAFANSLSLNVSVGPGTSLSAKESVSFYVSSHFDPNSGYGYEPFTVVTLNVGVGVIPCPESPIDPALPFTCEVDVTNSASISGPGGGAEETLDFQEGIGWDNDQGIYLQCFGYPDPNNPDKCSLPLSPGLYTATVFLNDHMTGNNVILTPFTGAGASISVDYPAPEPSYVLGAALALAFFCFVQKRSVHQGV